ncbi:MAG: hypothetical protein HUK20_13205 [Fibrobacter sp.]|nr:hypothetical protein [Fibrobacter sp.]
MQPRFKLPLTAQQAYDLLSAAYQAEVAARGRKYAKNGQTEAYLQQLAGYLTAENHKFGIMLCGTPGNGKTTTLLAFQNAVNYLRQQSVLPADQPNAISIVDAKDAKHYFRDPRSSQQLKDRPMLGIEDMGREPKEILDYGNVTTPIIDLLEHRYNNQLFTFITTNLTAQQIRETYGNRIADRFNEMLHVIIYANPSFRK